MSDEQFYQLCRANPDLKFEKSRKGELIVLSPTGGETGSRNSELGADFVIWNRRTRLGKVFDSSTCFRLPNGGNRSPDVAWIRQARWDALAPAEKETFPPIAPDFVLELTSPSDRLTEVQAKMQEYQASGVCLGWLIHPQGQRVEIYRDNGEVAVLNAPTQLSGEAVLPDFVLNLQDLWS
jgi:Uma2 family endonuclease